MLPELPAPFGHVALLPGKGTPVLVEGLHVLAAQQRVLPLLHLHLEGQRQRFGGALVVVTPPHRRLVRVQRTVHAVQPEQRGPEREQQNGGECQLQFDAEFHGVPGACVTAAFDAKGPAATRAVPCRA
jgi:hypothetical protein